MDYNSLINLTQNLNPDDIVKMCSISPYMYHSICSKKSFWQPIFNRYQFQLPDYNITLTKDWILIFYSELKIQRIVNSIDDLYDFDRLDLLPRIELVANYFLDLAKEFGIHGKSDYFTDGRILDSITVDHLGQYFFVTIYAEKHLRSLNGQLDRVKKFVEVLLRCYRFGSRIVKKY